MSANGVGTDPGGLSYVLELLAGIYFLNVALISEEGAAVFFCWIRAGVLQGCPLSGLIFVLVMDPFLSAIQVLIDRMGYSLT